MYLLAVKNQNKRSISLELELLGMGIFLNDEKNIPWLDRNNKIQYN
jgi:hypothetical protein